MLKKLLFAVLVLAILGLSAWWIHGMDIYLFGFAPWALSAAFVLGTALGITRSIITSRGKYRQMLLRWLAKSSGKTERHTLDGFLEHWGTATGIFISIFSGYWIKSGGLFARNLHFLGVFVTLFFGSYFLADFIISKKYNEILPTGKDITQGTIGKYFTRSYWSDSGKYLAAQKSAFLAFTVIGSEILFTGVIKMAAFFKALPPDVLKISTYIHDVVGILLVLLIFTHIFIVVTVRLHRPLLGHWLSGDLPEKLPEPCFTEAPVGEKVEDK